MISNLIYCPFIFIYIASIPSVHPGSVISGVMTCGHGMGYCFQGDDCTADMRFIPDLEGHCNGLYTTLFPNQPYLCCQQVSENSSFQLEDLETALLNSTEIYDSVDVLNRANGIADVNDMNLDHAEDETLFDTTTNVGEQEGEQITDSSSSADSSAHEFLKIHRALFGDHVKNEMNCTGHDHASLFPLSPTPSVPAELRGTAIKEKFDKNKCLNLTNQFEGADEGCVNIWKFVSNDELLCVGTLINSVWVLTSAACVTKMFNEGVQIDTIIATDIEEKSGYYGISNMIVHENYMIEGNSDMHDIGLVSLNQIVNVSCFGCLPVEERKYVDKSCTTYMMSGNRKSREFLGKCQDRLKILNMNSKMYLSLPCSMDEEHPFAADGHSANALWCENKLVGIETLYDQGYFVFTPINDYVEWITHNVELYL